MKKQFLDRYVLETNGQLILLTADNIDNYILVKDPKYDN